jgi:histidinol-phosphatase
MACHCGGTLIGLELIQPDQSHGRLVGGVIHMPALREMVYAADGDGAWHVAEGLEPVQARVSPSAALEGSLICTTSHEYWARNNREHLYIPLCRAGKRSRGWSDCYAHLLVATGRADAVVEPGVHPWDVAATIPVIREAGGRCTDWQGRRDPLDGDKSGDQRADPPATPRFAEQEGLSRRACSPDGL